MRFIVAGALILTCVAGCSRAGEKEHVGAAPDSAVTSRQTEDTTIITSDTTVMTDTTGKKGMGTVRVDTTRSQ